ncbi:LamG domain-containing protein [Agaribacterium haliotis]|uniref:LamG domain-containing protein n=1 Tax=Agaribacterium haliotis TaxID=2013869 RepID=UPI000BB58969|nr:LamG domain-containing protein [Agaribacterium haliotis]
MTRFARFFLLCFSLLPGAAWAAACTDIWPDGLQNSRNNGEIVFEGLAKLVGSPDNILDTRNLTNAPQGNDCDSAMCSQSGQPVPRGDIRDYPTGQPDVYLDYRETVTLSPGSYGELTSNTEAVLRLEPGVYRFRDSFILSYRGRIELTEPGSATIFVRKNVEFAEETELNLNTGDRHLFVFSREKIELKYRAKADVLLYARQDIVVQNEVEITGALTSEQKIDMKYLSQVSFDDSAINYLDFDGFCEGGSVVVPEPIAEWRLDETSWNGGANEVDDATGNGWHGQAVNLNAFPGSDNSDPVVDGSPGTCSYGDFMGTSDGYLQIDDAGNSDLDQNRNFTVATWVYPYSWASSGLATIVSKDENWEFHLNGSGQINWWWEELNASSTSITSSTSVPLNQWSHIAITFEEGTQNIYLNGVVVASDNRSSRTETNNDPILIGTDLNFHSRRFNGRIDEVKYYNETLNQAQVIEVMGQVHECVSGSTLDHFNIDTNGNNASVCAPQAITISARDSSDAILTGYVGTMALTTSTGNGTWLNDLGAALGSFTPGALDSGQASYIFEINGNDEGEISLSLDNSHAETLTISVADNDLGISSTSSTLTYAENGFVVEPTDGPGAVHDDFIAARAHNFTVTAMEQDPTNPDDCQVLSGYNQPAIKVWFDRSSSDAGGQAPSISGAALPEAATTNVNLNFSSGVAQFALDTYDVGQFSLFFRDDSNAFSDQLIEGSSSLLTFRPFAFAVTAPHTGHADSALGPVFTAAGQDFQVNVIAKGWHSADDSDDNGVPDIYEDSGNESNNDVLNGPDLVRFAQEGAGTAVVLAANLYLPQPGNDPGLASSVPGANRLTSFSSGLASTSQVNYPEVGIILLSAELENPYLGISQSRSEKSHSRSAHVGRFIPSYFLLNDASLVEACTSFSYLGQVLNADINNLSAHNLGAAITRNYEGDFAKLSNSSHLNYQAIDQALPTPFTGRVSEQNSSFNWSQGVLSLDSELILERDNSNLEGPFNNVAFGLAVADGDDVRFRSSDFDLDTDNDTVSDSIEVGRSVQRFGRLRLEDAFGPESSALPVLYQTEFWNGAWFELSAADSCTEILLSDQQYAGQSIDIPANRSVTVGSGSTTGSYSQSDAIQVQFAGGDAGLSFSAPGAGNTGSFFINADLNNYPWLRFDWDQDGSHSDTTIQAEIRFGTYRNHDRVIFWQEVLDNSSIKP